MSVDGLRLNCRKVRHFIELRAACVAVLASVSASVTLVPDFGSSSSKSGILPFSKIWPRLAPAKYGSGQISSWIW